MSNERATIFRRLLFGLALAAARRVQASDDASRCGAAKGYYSDPDTPDRMEPALAAGKTCLVGLSRDRSLLEEAYTDMKLNYRVGSNKIKLLVKE